MDIENRYKGLSLDEMTKKFESDKLELKNKFKKDMMITIITGVIGTGILFGMNSCAKQYFNLPDEKIPYHTQEIKNYDTNK